jgi:hypothetical protein
MLLPASYKAMCCECGELVQHRLDRDEALPCGNGQLVAPTIARAALVPFRPPTAEPGSAKTRFCHQAAQHEREGAAPTQGQGAQQPDACTLR